MDDLAEKVLKTKNRRKSRYVMAREFGYSSVESGIMQNWSIKRILRQATKDCKTKELLNETAKDVTEIGDKNE